MARCHDLRDLCGLLSLVLLIGSLTATACAPDDAERTQLRGGGGDERAQNHELTENTPQGGDRASSLTAKEQFATNVQPRLAATCGGCHAVGPGPAWIVPSDIDKSYALMFSRGYVVAASVLLTKGPHATGAPALSTSDARSVSQWIELEAKERGDKAPPSVLTKVARCLDRAKFDAIGLDKLTTTPRTAANNPNKYTENANECTGCKNAPCSTCHSADAASGFIMAMGNTLLPEEHTFNETKSTHPPYLQKYFGLDTEGRPLASHAIKAKADASLTAKPYTHPMFKIPAATEAALDAFVEDAIARYASRQCAEATEAP